VFCNLKFIVHEFVYTNIVKNVTISLPEGVLEALRLRADSERMSLNAWLRELLSREVQQESTNWSDTFLELSGRLSKPAPEWTWSRDETYAERLR